MAISQGVDRTIYYKNETTWADTALSGASAKTLRRVQTSLQLQKQTYQSQEIVQHLQVSDFRHGSRIVQGQISGELSPSTYQDFIGAALRKYTWATISNLTAQNVAFSGTSNPITATGTGTTWLTAGLKVGMVIRCTAGTGLTTMLNRNLLIVNITSNTSMTLIADGTPATESSTSATIAIPGAMTYAPGSSQDNPIKSFALEDYHPISGGVISERFWGCRVGGFSVNLPAQGMATISLDVMGKDMTTAAAQWSSGVTAPTSTGVCAAVNGAVVAGATMTQQLAVTAAQFSVQTGLSNAQLVGSLVTPDIFAGRIQVSGQIQAYFENATLRDEFINETESGLVLWVKADGNVGGSFISFAFPRIKWGAATKDDGEKGIIQTLPFTALYNAAGGTGVKTEKTSIWIHDGSAT